MTDINTRKRGKKWEYYFEAARIGGKRQRISKGGFSTKAEAMRAGVEAMHEYQNAGTIIVPADIWQENHRLSRWSKKALAMEKKDLLCYNGVKVCQPN